MNSSCLTGTVYEKDLGQETSETLPAGCGTAF